MEFSAVQGLMNALGATEEPLGIFYTDTEPAEGLSPKPRGGLPSAAEEARGELDFGKVFADFSCIMSYVWRARRQKTAAYFDQERQGCLGGAFYLGYLKPQLNVIAHYVPQAFPGSWRVSASWPLPRTFGVSFRPWIPVRLRPGSVCSNPYNDI